MKTFEFNAEAVQEYIKQQKDYRIYETKRMKLSRNPVIEDLRNTVMEIITEFYNGGIRAIFQNLDYQFEIRIYSLTKSYGDLYIIYKFTDQTISFLNQPEYLYLQDNKFTEKDAELVKKYILVWIYENV
jgi:hypothetical protein